MNKDLKGVNFIQPAEVDCIVGDWHMALRLNGRTVSSPTGKIPFLLYVF